MKRDFLSGPPPHVGWWLTTDELASSGEWWRWWNGKFWGKPVPADSELEDFGYYSQKSWMHKIRWCRYWPENARVPRLDESWTWHLDGKEPTGFEGPVIVILRDGTRGMATVGREPSVTDWRLLGNGADIVAYKRWP